MKKLIGTLIFTAMMAVTMVGCSSKSDTPNTVTPTTGAETGSNTDKDEKRPKYCYCK